MNKQIYDKMNAEIERERKHDENMVYHVCDQTYILIVHSHVELRVQK